ncbi:MAG: UDP-glucose/GDP-mannose dehydrogenase family protein [Planctomycetota bacterium]|nr:UDP-glucose/GDP-mannose dehydrogenase family protein [Planctomycetota bacterium]
MKIAVIGTGYVGLVAGACFADAGHEVVCVDVDPEKIRKLEAGEVPIYEPGLGGILDRVRESGHIRYTTSHAEAVPGSRVVFIGVGTPEGEGGAPDMSYVFQAVRDVLAAVDGPTVLVMKSTVPVGTAAKVRALCGELTTQPIDVVSNPEFLKEGAAVDDFLRPDRVVIGTDSDSAWETMQELYLPFTLKQRPIIRMSNVSAELTKYAANAMLATRISFMNEIARLCDGVGADVKQVAEGIGTDSRIGRPFLFAGCGYGGSCFPKDTQGLMHVARDAGMEMEIVQAVEDVNDDQKMLLANRVVARFGEDLTGKRFALWGLAFKPKTDDVREAPAQIIVEELLSRGAEVVGSDPEGIDNFRKLFGDRMIYEKDPYKAASGADAVLLCTEWMEFRAADFGKLKSVLRAPVIFDGRNVLDPAKARAAGFEYEGIGRGVLLEPAKEEAGAS